MVLTENACLDGGRAPACLLGLREPSKASKAPPKVAKRAGHLHMLGSHLNAQRAIVELDCLFSTALQHATGGEPLKRAIREPSQLGARLSMDPSPAPYAAERLPREKLLRVIETWLQQLHVYCTLLRFASVLSTSL